MDDIRKKLENMVIDSLKDIMEEYDSDEEFKSDFEVTSKSRIYGGDSPLDSMAVVSMIVDLESRLAEELDFEISIVDERAMSQMGNPFRDVPSIVDYLLVLYQENQNE